MNKIKLLLLFLLMVSPSLGDAETLSIDLDTGFGDGGYQYSDPDENLDYNITGSDSYRLKMVSNGYTFYLMNSMSRDAILHVFTPSSVNTYLYMADMPSTADADTLSDSDCDSTIYQTWIQGIAIEDYPPSGDANLIYVGSELESCYGAYIGLSTLDIVTNIDWLDSIKRPGSMGSSGAFYGVDMTSSYMVATGYKSEKLSLFRVTYGSSGFSSTEVYEEFDLDSDSTIYERGYDVQIADGFYIVGGGSYDSDATTYDSLIATFEYDSSGPTFNKIDYDTFAVGSKSERIKILRSFEYEGSTYAVAGINFYDSDEKPDGTGYIRVFKFSSSGSILSSFTASETIDFEIKDISVNVDHSLIAVAGGTGLEVFTFDPTASDEIVPFQSLDTSDAFVSTSSMVLSVAFYEPSTSHLYLRIGGVIDETEDTVFIMQYTVSSNDEDGDGYTTDDSDPALVDCDDTDADINPGVTRDTCGDGVDNDCDGSVDEDVRAFGETLGECDGIDNDCDGSIDEFLKDTYYYDFDGDGYGDEGGTTTTECPGFSDSDYVLEAGDCDDSDPSASPGRTEVCDDIDNDCDTLIDEDDDSLSGADTWYADNDRDGRGSSSSGTTVACSQPTGYASSNTDCDDTDSTIYPGRTEVCDEKDNDCDGTVDDSPVGASTWYADSDGDSYGSSSSTTTACTAPTGYVSNDDDCDDTRGAVNPVAPEICDGRDNDCDASIDEPGSLGAGIYQYRDADGDGYGDSSIYLTTCSTVLLPGYVADNTDCDDSNYGVNPAGTESCDGLDNDCNGIIDDGFGTTRYYRDADGDTYGDPSNTIRVCGARPAGYVGRQGDCNDSDPAINQGATEICDGQDNDCDFLTDESGSSVSWYTDSDGDTYGDASTSVTSCASPGTGYVLDGSDCDDTDSQISPLATEICDLKDNDCDGGIDDSDPDGIPSDATSWFEDSDVDGFGLTTSEVVLCEAPAGYMPVGGDCDDTRGDVSPAMVENMESCEDGIDQDCSGEDLACPASDDDADGYYSVADGGNDCDDTNPRINPGAFEECDSDAVGIDENCDGLIDDADPTTNETTKTTWYLDTDEDTFGSLENGPSIQACDQPADYVNNNTDCNDNQNAINPLASEVCADSIDNDCDIEVDEECSGGGTDTSGSTGGECTDPQNWYPDVDLDGFGDALSVATSDCTAPEGFVDNNTDCDDADNTVNPDASESCEDSIDNDCDGEINEGCTTGTDDSSGTTGTDDSSGTTGTDDSSGTTGTDDSSGTTGTDDSSGTTGTDDSSGTTGTDDSSGTTGTDDSSGTTGTDDSSGTTGTDDSSGTTGTDDSSGTTGTDDSSGTTGTDDSSGTTGTDDSSGTTGTDDSSGTTGTDDSSGTTGTDDSSGTTGTDDSSGTTGTDDSSGTTGTDDSSGTTGTDDSSGTTGTDDSAGGVGTETSGSDTTGTVDAGDSGTETTSGTTDSGEIDTGATDVGTTDTGTTDSGTTSTGSDTGVSPSEPGPEGDEGETDGPGGLSLKPSGGCSLNLY